MKDRRWWSLPGILGIFVIGLSLIVMDIDSERKEKKSDGMDDVAENEVTSKSNDINRNDKKTHSKSRLRTLKKQLSNVKFEKKKPIDDRLQAYLDATGYSKEEVEEINRIVTKSEPYYWDNAASTLAEMLKSQEKDLNWVSEIEEQVMLSLKSEAVEHTDLDGVDCRETLCRISFIHKDVDGHDHVRDILNRSEWLTTANAFGTRETLNNGKIRSYVYITKQDDDETFLEMRKRIIEKVESQSSS